MRTILHLFLFLLLSFTFSGAKKRKVVEGPPGTVWVKDTVFMDKYEVSNLDYREYIYWLKTHYGSQEPYIVKKAMPDTLVWRSYGTYREDLASGYFSHPAYSGFPVVGVSFQQAMDYCKWRTGRTKEYFKSAGKKKYVLPSNVEDFYYRLPTVKEWETAAYAGLDTAKHPFGYEYLDDTLHIDKVHVKQSYGEVVGMSYNGEPVKTGFGPPNRFGFYNMIGNVAEMTAEKGIAKGGSFKDYLDQCHIRDSAVYSVPSNWLGFRCVCIVKYKSGCDPVSGSVKR